MNLRPVSTRCLLVLLLGGFAAAALAAPANDPPKLHAAIEALKLAQRNLEAAPSDHGGHRNKALQLVERAIEQCERSADALHGTH